MTPEDAAAALVLAVLCQRARRWAAAQRPSEPLPAAVPVTRAATAVRAVAEAREDWPDPTPGQAGRASRQQVGAVIGEFRRLGCRDRRHRLDYTAAAVGRPVGSGTELTQAEAGALLRMLREVP